MITSVISINIAVADSEEAIKRYRDVLGIEPVYFKPEDFAFPNLKGAQFHVGNTILNIIGSHTDDTSIARFVKKLGDGVFLVALETNDVDKDVKEMKEKGVQFVTGIIDVPLGRTTFAHPRSMHGVQFEIVQLKK
jgi:methylmalonyl-CoA/ethylmalonyl-CoA epimerase